jgi:4-hydroxythreonine-4-phosphate dehydrogenase
MPRLLITMGDVAGVGPEIIARAWPEMLTFSEPVVVGDPEWMRRGQQFVGSKVEIPVLKVTTADLSKVHVGEVSAAAGQAAFDFLCAAIDRTLAGEADAIVTCPLHKEGLHAAGVPHPGHTEILAERTGAKSHAMLLHGDGITVAHVTLHMSVREAVTRINADSVRATIDLLHGILPKLTGGRAHIGVCALNPHASDGGLFGDEEKRIIAPVVEQEKAAGIDLTGPIPSDALWVRAAAGEFDGVVAMYHDQGHIPMKMLTKRRAVNITAGLPIVRTSVAHGTAYDIAGRGVADASSLVLAARVAAKLCVNSRRADWKTQ